MKETFRWNPLADQPHNVGSRGRRFLRHLIHAPSYLGLIGSNLKKAVPVILRYRFLRSITGCFPAPLEDPFGVAVSPAEGREIRILELLRELGITRTLLRIPSWDAHRLEAYAEFHRLLTENGVDVLLALLQRRRDVTEPAGWRRFLEQVFDRFGSEGAVFEVGHAWNRTKWGLWDHREYIRLARTALDAARRLPIRLAGPAAIDFEFHLYPPVLKRIPFDVVSSLLYVDRTGPPESTQFGWDLLRKLALLRAIVDTCSTKGRALWITEFNWPLEDTGEYSPAAGRPNVSEERQADYLVRYYLLASSTGWVERIFWWQLAAPGYGLVDTRSEPWRRRPAFRALQTMKRLCTGSVYQGRFPHPTAQILNFCRGRKVFAAAWAPGDPVEFRFPVPVVRILDRDGRDQPVAGRTVLLNGSPRYFVLEPGGDPPGT
jgi:hypothetical protein